MNGGWRIRAWTLVGAVVVLLLAGFGYFSVQYGSVSWLTQIPPELNVEGREYKPSKLPPTETAPQPDSPASPEWYPKHHMWPLGYDIYWPRGYETSTAVILQWRDGLFYPYTLQGGP